MPVIENNSFVEDAWTHMEDGDSAKNRSMIIVPLARLEEVLTGWPAGHRGLGVDVPNDVDVDVLTRHLARLDIVTLNFPSFADGRAFSQARSIRHTDHFGGTIRARGGFLRTSTGSCCSRAWTVLMCRTGSRWKSGYATPTRCRQPISAIM